MATIPVGPGLWGRLPLSVLLLAVPPLVYVLSHPMVPVPLLAVPVPLLAVVPVPLMAVVGCAPAAVLDLAAPTHIRATAASAAATEAPTAAPAACFARVAVPTPTFRTNVAYSAAAPAMAVAHSVHAAVSPSCMDSRVSVRCLTRTHHRVVHRCYMGARSNLHPPTGYTSLVDGCEALLARADGLDLAANTT